MRTLDVNSLRDRMEIAYMNYRIAKRLHRQSKYHTKDQNKQNAQIVADAKREYEFAREAYLNAV